MVRGQYALGGNYFPVEDSESNDTNGTYSPYPANGRADLTIYGYDQDEIEWRLEANCNGADQDLFFPGQGGETMEARRICQGCAVRVECWGASIGRNEKWGIWGGFAHKERVRVRRLVSEGKTVEQAMRIVDKEAEHKLTRAKNMQGLRGYPRDLA